MGCRYQLVEAITTHFPAVTSVAQLASGFAARLWWFAIGIERVEALLSLTNDNPLFSSEIA